jgi:hypothetical protein
MPTVESHVVFRGEAKCVDLGPWISCGISSGMVEGDMKSNCPPAPDVLEFSQDSEAPHLTRLCPVVHP